MLSGRPPCDEGVVLGVPASAHPAGARGKWVLAATILGSSMAFIDGTAVNVALPVMQRELGASAAEAQWVVEAYALFLSALLLVGGSLGDHFGRRRVFCIGVGIFALASALCGLSPNIELLIFARGIQGVGAALLTPGSLAILSAQFDEHERGRAIGTWSGFTAIAGAAGPLLGGWLVEHASFHWIFFINLPIAAAVLLLTLRKVRESRDDQASGPLDWRGALLAALGLGALVYGLISFSMPERRVWSATTMLAGVLALVAFVRVEQTTSSPMLPLSFFRSGAFLGANLVTLFLYAALGGLFFFLPFTLIGVRNYSPASAGAAMLPLVIIVFGLSRWSGGLVDRYGARRPLIIGPLIAGLGFGMFAVPGMESSYLATCFFPSVVLGLGMAISVAPLTTVVMSSVPPGRAGTASAVNNAVARTSGLLAIAAFGIVVSLVFAYQLRTGLFGHFPKDAAELVFAQRARLTEIDVRALPSGLCDMAKSLVGRAYLCAFRVTALLSAVLAWVSAAITGRLIPGPTGKARHE